jgi:hypothetical protein
MTAFRHHMKLWSIWLLLASAALMANPWGRHGWLELTAALAPMIMMVDRRIWREPALAIGLPALTLLWLADPTDSSIVRLLVAWVVFAGGILLAARAINSQSELEAIAGRVAFSPLDTMPPVRFELALERELGRARRHDRPFALLSASADPHSLEAEPSGFYGTELLRSLAENRARLELYDFLRTELHIYAEVAADRSRILALVPEVGSDALAFLLERLQNTANEQLDFDVHFGAGCFPRDAVCADELIAAADRNRTASKLRSLPERVGVVGIEPPGRRSPDVQG